MAPLVFSRTPISSLVLSPVDADAAARGDLPRHAKIGFSTAVGVLLRHPNLRDHLGSQGVSYDPKEGFSGPDLHTTPDNVLDFSREWHEWNREKLEAYFEFLDKHNIEEYDDALVSVLSGLGLAALVALAADLAGIRAEGGGTMGEATEWVVRWLGGNIDTLSLVLRAMKRKLQGKAPDKADKFGGWALAGTLAGPALHGLHESVGEGANQTLRALYGSAYPNADNLMGGVGELIGNIREKGLRQGWEEFTLDTFQMWNLGIISANVAINLLVHVGLLQHDWVRSNMGAVGETALMNTDTAGALLRIRLLNIREAEKVARFAADPVRMIHLAEKFKIVR